MKTETWFAAGFFKFQGGADPPNNYAATLATIFSQGSLFHSVSPKEYLPIFFKFQDSPSLCKASIWIWFCPLLCTHVPPASTSPASPDPSSPERLDI